MAKTTDVKQMLSEKKSLRMGRTGPVRDKDLLSSGSTMLNLAVSDRPNGCFLKGGYYWLVGDSNSGKTWLSLTCFAEAMLNKNFKDYRLILDDAEGGSKMDIAKYFGDAVAERVEAPMMVDGKPSNSTTIEDFYYNITDKMAEGIPFIYVLDSMDALDSEADDAKFEKAKKASRKKASGEGDEKTAGNFGMAKAKRNSEYMRKVAGRLNRTGSILIVISQSRDNVKMFSFETQTAAGGKSLKFYATAQLWTSIKSTISKKITLKGKKPTKHKYGIVGKVQVKKNRITGKDRFADMPIYNSYGIDDIGSCIDYLTGAGGHWKIASGIITATDFDFTGKRDALIKKIEEEELERELRGLVGDTWNAIEQRLTPARKKRY